MTYKQIEASREARLWLGQILVPAVTLAVSTLAIPGVKDALAKKVDDVKSENSEIERYCEKLDKSAVVYYTMRTEKSQESCCTPLAKFVQLRYNVNKERRKCYD